MFWRLLESVHGHFGVLAAVALLHPAILLRRGLPMSRGVRLSVVLTTSITTVAFGLGIAIYEAYRGLVKRDLFTVDYGAGMLFETKEHLAYTVVFLAVGAGACALLAPPKGVALRRASSLLFAIAATLCFVVVGLGSYIASIRGFPS